MKPIGVIIINWNGAALLRRYLPTVIAGNSNEIADVIVVDNGSSDNSREVLEKEFPNVKTIYCVADDKSVNISLFHQHRHRARLT